MSGSWECGGTVARDKQDLGTGIQVLWCVEETQGHWALWNLTQKESAGREGRVGEKGPRKGTGVRAQSWEKTKNGSGDPEAKTGKNRKNTKQNIRTENSLVGTPGNNNFSAAS